PFLTSHAVGMPFSLRLTRLRDRSPPYMGQLGLVSSLLASPLLEDCKATTPTTPAKMSAVPVSETTRRTFERDFMVSTPSRRPRLAGSETCTRQAGGYVNYLHLFGVTLTLVYQISVPGLVGPWMPVELPYKAGEP